MQGFPARLPRPHSGGSPSFARANDRLQTVTHNIGGAGFVRRDDGHAGSEPTSTMASVVLVITPGVLLIFMKTSGYFPGTTSSEGTGCT